MVERETLADTVAMSCEDVRDLLYLLLTNELEPEETEQVLLHLAKCPGCLAALAQHAKLAGTLEQTLKMIPPHYYSRYN